MDTLVRKELVEWQRRQQKSCIGAPDNVCLDQLENWYVHLHLPSTSFYHWYTVSSFIFITRLSHHYYHNHHCLQVLVFKKTVFFSRFTCVATCLFQVREFLGKLEELVGKLSYEKDPVKARKPGLQKRADALLKDLLQRSLLGIILNSFGIISSISSYIMISEFHVKFLIL